MLVDKLKDRFYGPRYGDHYDGTKRFYDLVRKGCAPHMRVLNLGAGPATKNPLRILKGEVREVVGADVETTIFDNPELDRAVLIANGRLPLEDASFDLVFSDYVLEHVEHPAAFMAEVFRVLKPGGSFYFRTPNKWHYVALIAGATSHRFHTRFANAVRRSPEDAHEPWPTFYRMNTPKVLRELARHQGFSAVELEMVEMEPSYLAFSAPFFLAGLGYERLVNGFSFLEGARANIFGRFVK